MEGTTQRCTRHPDTKCSRYAIHGTGTYKYFICTYKQNIGTLYLRHILSRTLSHFLFLSSTTTPSPTPSLTLSRAHSHTLLLPHTHTHTPLLHSLSLPLPYSHSHTNTHSFPQVEQLEYMPFDPIVKRTEGTIKDLATGKTYKTTKGAPHVLLKLVRTIFLLWLPLILLPLPYI